MPACQAYQQEPPDSNRIQAQCANIGAMASFYLRARDRQALWGDNLADEFGSVN
jgi:hypothetical protein